MADGQATRENPADSLADAFKGAYRYALKTARDAPFPPAILGMMEQDVALLERGFDRIKELHGPGKLPGSLGELVQVMRRQEAIGARMQGYLRPCTERTGKLPGR